MKHLKNRTVGIVSMNLFLSSITDRYITLGFVLASIEGRSDIEELNIVLFKIKVDLSLVMHTLSVNISKRSMLTNDEEHLFHLNYFFWVVVIEGDQYAENITIIRLVLASLFPRQDGDIVHSTRTIILKNIDDIGRMGTNIAVWRYMWAQKYIHRAQHLSTRAGER